MKECIIGSLIIQNLESLYKNTLLNSKLEQDFYKINRKWLLQEFHLNPFLAECADRAYEEEELTGEKIGD